MTQDPYLIPIYNPSQVFLDLEILKFFDKKPFYKIPKANRFNLLYDAKEKANFIWLTELNPKKSFDEVKSEKTFEEILEIYKKTLWFNRSLIFIKRNQTIFDPEYEDFLEVKLSCNAKDGIKYSIAIYLDQKFEKYFINKYKLKLKKN